MKQILAWVICSVCCFAQSIVVIPRTRVNGVPATNLVTICSTNPGHGSCSSLVTTYTDKTLATPCSGSGGPLSGTGCSNPGNSDAAGNVVAFAAAGQYWCQTKESATAVADSVACAATSSGTFTTVTATGSINFTTMLITATLPTIAANGCGGAAAAIVSANSTAAFDIDVGTTPTSGGCTVTMPTASDDWHCWVNDYTTISVSVFMQRQIAGSTNSITLANYNAGVSQTAPVAHDIYHVICMAH